MQRQQLDTPLIDACERDHAMTSRVPRALEELSTVKATTTLSRLPCCFTHIRNPASSFSLSYVSMDLQLRSDSLLFSLVHLKTMACLLTCSFRLNSVHASPAFSHLSHPCTFFHEMAT